MSPYFKCNIIIMKFPAYIAVQGRQDIYHGLYTQG